MGKIIKRICEFVGVSVFVCVYAIENTYTRMRMHIPWSIIPKNINIKFPLQYL